MPSGLGEKSGCYPPLGRSLNGMRSMLSKTLYLTKLLYADIQLQGLSQIWIICNFFNVPFFTVAIHAYMTELRLNTCLRKRKKKKQLSLTYTFLSLPRNLPVICSFCSVNQFSPPTFLLCLSQLHKLCSLGSATGQAMKSVSFLDVCNN